MPDLVANALLQGATYGIAVLGLAFAFRILRYPDLTADGSFMTGATVFASGVVSGWSWPAALAVAVGAGAAAGMLTALLNAWLHVSRLLTGILVTMICYSLAFRYLGGQSNIGLTGAETMFATSGGVARTPYLPAIAGLFAMGSMLLVRLLLGSELGLMLRATGGNAALVEEFGRSPAAYRVIGLALANGLIALSGALVAGQQGFADVNMGAGTIITLVASLIIGEEILRLTSRGRIGLVERVLAPFAGAIVYFALYIAVLRASLDDFLPVRIEPTDLKMLSALIVILVIALRMRGGRQEEVLPL